MDIMTRREAVDRYLRIEAWARRRYSYINAKGQTCWLSLGMGLQTPSRVTRIEDLAAVRYLGCAERWRGWRLLECPTR